MIGRTSTGDKYSQAPSRPSPAGEGDHAFWAAPVRWGNRRNCISQKERILSPKIAASMPAMYFIASLPSAMSVLLLLLLPFFQFAFDIVRVADCLVLIDVDARQAVVDIGDKPSLLSHIAAEHFLRCVNA